METADPDDFLTLCFLLSHPDVNLTAVTVTPGGKLQVGLVKKVLEIMETDIPVGARNPDHQKQSVSSYYHKLMGHIPEAEADDYGYVVMASTLEKYPDLTILTGAPLPNLGLLIGNFPDIKLKRWVAQGGFAGDNIVPKEKRLPKFNGKILCPTFNFNGDVKSAKLLLSSDKIEKRICISKNVCHGVVYTQDLHEEYAAIKNKTKATALIYKAMDIYLKKHPDGKKLHDPLAACTAINENVCELKEVEIYREKGMWGSRPRPDSGTWISISHNQKLFENLFLFRE